MTHLDMFAIVMTTVLAGAAMVYIARIIKHSGRDRPEDPARVAELVRTAPVERLHNIMSR